MEKVVVRFNYFCCWMLAFTVLLSGCLPNSKQASSREGQSGLTKAAAFLASKVEKSGGFIAGEDLKRHDAGDAYVYDNALAAIVLACSGADALAQKIADAMVFAQDHDRSFQDGRLRNAYVSGNPKSDSGRSIAFGKVTVRLPGFWKDGRWQEDLYSVSTSAGTMAWAILALCKVAERAEAEPQKAYLSSAVRAADFTLKLHSVEQGFTAGFEGWDDAQEQVRYRSTEQNMVLSCAFTLLSQILEQRDPEKAEDYRRAADDARNFVLSMYDEERCCFYAGTEADGKKVSKAVIPLNANSLPLLALDDDRVDISSLLSFIETQMAVGHGFDYSTGDLDGIWNEGTAQMAVGYRMLGLDEPYTRRLNYLKTEEKKDGSIPAADRNGVSTGFASVGSEELWEYDNVLSIAATAWLAFVQMNCNPLTNASN